MQIMTYITCFYRKYMTPKNDITCLNYELGVFFHF